jgi:hypothetical protein
LKYTYTVEVFRDKVTGACYTKKFSHKPVAVLDGPGPATVFGLLLQPYEGPLSEDVELRSEDQVPSRDEIGYPPEDLCQELLVTKDQFAERFESLGLQSEEIDLEAAVRQYEQENCDFSDREYVLRHAQQMLQRESYPGHWACVTYTLIKDYQANTSKKP